MRVIQNENDSVTVIVDEETEGSRLDKTLALCIHDSSRSFLQKQIESGNVILNGIVQTNKKHKVIKDDEITVLMPEPEKIDIKAEDIPLEIVYEDDDLLVVNKPRGMVVHPAAGNYRGTLVNAIMYHCGDRLSSINGVVRPGIVHRIDKDTSGLLVIAKNDFTHNDLARQLKEHTVEREYKAIVYNNFSEDEGTINKPLGRDPSNRLRRAVTEKNSKNAITHYKVLERFGKYTLISAKLETGRTHQIRVHMAYIKHPLVGDELYGPKTNPFGVNGQLLHAGSLGFIHPVTEKHMIFFKEPPEEFQRVLKKLKENI